MRKDLRQINVKIPEAKYRSAKALADMLGMATGTLLWHCAEATLDAHLTRACEILHEHQARQGLRAQMGIPAMAWPAPEDVQDAKAASARG
jgi:hypothetical protein